MFTSQTSSFQDSIDVEERDDFESEDISGYNQKLNCYYAIYLYQGTRSESAEESVAWNKRRADSTTSQDDFSLSLVDSSLPSEAEPELRCYISRRLSKGALLGGMGNIATVELSVPEQNMGCYCCLLEQEHSPEQPDADGNGYVICFLGDSEKGLNLFRLELDKYVQGLQSCLQTPELTNLETEIRPYLSLWYEESVLHVQRVVQLVQGRICFLLHAALSHTHVEVVHADERTKKDIARFIKAASLLGLSQQEATTSLCKAAAEEPPSDLLIDCSTSPPTLSNMILENFKLKAIQDMNSLKRFVRQAEMSHYALFRCCQFLQGCGNSDVLLQNAKAEHSDLPEACRIISVLEEFLREPSQAHT